jgi:hypothetical protein
VVRSTAAVRGALSTVLLVMAGLAVVVTAATAARATPGPGVYILGDSVTAGAESALQQSLVPSYPGTIINAAVCRGLTTSCPYNGSTPTTGMAEIAANASHLGDVLVMELGYNDKPSASAIDAAMSALTAQDVPLVLWVGLSTLNRPDFAPVNDRLQAATARWPTLRVLDWDGTSKSHPSWFVPDDGVGVHLTKEGATAYAGWLKGQLDAVPGIGVPPPATQHCAATVAIGTPEPAPAAQPATPPDAGAGFTGIQPKRLLDSRSGRPVGAGRAIELQITGRAGVPPGATAAALNVTAIDPCAAGFVTVYPCGSTAPPLASNVNYVAKEARPNLVVARLSTSGRACLYSMVQTDVAVDLMGWFAADAGDRAVATSPVRALDTRAMGRVGAGQAIAVAVTGTGLAPTTARGAILNLTATDARAPGYVTVWPASTAGACDPAARPDTSNVNIAGADPVANLVMVRLGAGRVCVYAFSDTNVVLDLDGWFAEGDGTLQAQTPKRVLDTRDGTGGTAGEVAAGAAVAVDLGAGTKGAAVNLTAVLPRAKGFLTAWPARDDGTCVAADRPLASNLNYAAGQVVANLAVAATGATGRVCVYSFAATHLVVDVAATT